MIKKWLRINFPSDGNQWIHLIVTWAFKSTQIHHLLTDLHTDETCDIYPPPSSTDLWRSGASPLRQNGGHGPSGRGGGPWAPAKLAPSVTFVGERRLPRQRRHKQRRGAACDVKREAQGWRGLKNGTADGRTGGGDYVGKMINRRGDGWMNGWMLWHTAPPGDSTIIHAAVTQD